MKRNSTQPLAQMLNPRDITPTKSSNQRTMQPGLLTTWYKFIETFTRYWLVFLLYLAAGVVLIHFLRFYVDGIDMLNYITVSEKYVNGNFYDAINDYWSPMIPWLLIPFISFGVDPFFAFHILQLLIGLFTIKVCIELLEPIRINQWMKHLLRFSFIPLILSYGQLYGSPDLLFLTVLLYYLKTLISENYSGDHTYGLKAGTLGGLLFLTKAFGFPFFIFHFTIVNGIYWFRNRNGNGRKIIVRNFIGGFSMFILIAGIWVACMSWKNEAFTISGSGKYNFALVGPEYCFRPECYLCHPAHEQGLFNPANATAVNSTESPSLFHIHTWSPFASNDNFSHWLKVIRTNMESVYYFDFRRQIGIVLLITFLIFIITSGKLRALPFPAFILFVSCILYDLGYIFVIVNHRYIWMNTIIFILLFGFLLESLSFKNKRIYIVGTVLFFGFVFFLVKRPVKELFLLKDRDSSIKEMADLTLHPLNTIRHSVAPHIHLFKLISALKERQDMIGRIANQKRALTEDYKNTAIISYYLGNKHYGELTDAIIQREGYTQLRDFNIDLYYSWRNLTNVDMTFIRPPVYTDTISGLYIYRVSKR